MSLDLVVVITHQGHIEELLLFSQESKGPGDIGLKIVPLQAEFFRHDTPMICSPKLNY